MRDLLRAGRRAITLAVALLLVARACRLVRFPISRYVVDGASMEPAYHAGDRVLVNRLAYHRQAPTRGDVVVLRDPEREGRYLLKRVAIAQDGLGADAAFGGRVYVLGDNAAESRDSRAFGPLPAAAIIGKAWRTY